MLAHMFMPALALALPLAAIIGRVLKQSLKETMQLDYVTACPHQGLGETLRILREALRNAVLPTLTLVGVQFTFLIGGTVIIERLFSYEGLGNMAIDAVINRDLPLIQGLVLLFGVIFIAVNLVVDLTYARAEPEAAAWLRRSQAGICARRAAVAVGGWLAAGRSRRCWRPWIAPHDPLAQDLFLARLPPSGCRAPSRATGWAPTAWGATCCRASSMARASR